MYKILICDDERDIRNALRIYLTGEGYAVCEADSGLAALELMQREEVQLVLMDIMMPVLDGLDAARAIRALDRADARTVPILAVSANAFSDDIAASREAGMNGHLSKPLDFDRVAAVIAQYIRRS
mgnify:CR=1 FL=1